MSIQTYYKSQEKHHESRSASDGEHGWSNHETVDYQRHLRMYRLIDPILAVEKKAKWLTIGDGRYGHEAHYIGMHGSSATATDISTHRLKIAKDHRYIREYKKENAERMSFSDNAYDYILCKESYHHFPRPMIALYEMIRVAKKAVVLIEPNDVMRRSLTLQGMLAIENDQAYINSFEISGNYVYGISRRELTKVALGVGLPAIAYRGIDDYYIKGVESEMMSSHGPMQTKMNIMLFILDILHRLGARDRSLLSVILFKNLPSQTLIRALRKVGYTFRQLPTNPYI